MPEEFIHTDLRGARFVGADLSGAVMRGVDLVDVDIDAPWLTDGSVRINGVDVAPLVEAELDRRFPGRAERRAETPAELQSAWAALERSWATTLQRAAALPPGAVDESVDGEWSFAQTLRHLVFATDIWLRKAVQGVAPPYHPIGVTNSEAGTEGVDMSVFRTDVPPYAEVLEVRAEHVGLVRDFIATVTPEQLAAQRPSPWEPARQVSVRHCLHVILDEEWEHLRFAVRDLDTIMNA